MSWRRQRLALKKCLTRVYDVLLGEVSDMIEEEQNRKKRLWVQDWIGRRDSRGASTLFYNLHYSCSTNIRSRDKARPIYKCRPQSTSFSFCMKKSAAGFIKTRYTKLRNSFPSTAIVNRLMLLGDLHVHCDGLHRASRQSSER